MVIINEIPTSTANCSISGLLATVPKVITMISAERTKSVRTAPLILSFSNCTISTVSSSMASNNSAWCCASSSGLCSHLWAIFSNPSKHKYAPPIISNTVTNHGCHAASNKAKGTKIALLIIEPFATAQTTGNSRSALMPVTCWAFRAKSSPSTPAVFFAATLVITLTSSKRVAMSSIRVSKLAPAIGNS